MATRKDLLKAQAFTSRRMIAAFVDRDPDDPTPPLRRVGTATFVSVLLGVVLLAGVALIGMLRGGVTNDSWKETSPAILTNTESGSLFVWNGTSLVPMADIASARLAAAADAEAPTDAAPTIRVKTEALEGTPQAPMVGIPGAPRQLPDIDSMHGYPVRFCSTAPTGLGRYLTLEFGADAPIDWSTAFVAEDDSGRKQYLIYGGRAHDLWQDQGDRSPLVGALPVVQPGNAWINAIPIGAAIRAEDVPLRGEDPNPDVALRQLRVGQFAMVAGVGEAPNRYYVMLKEGLSRIAFLEMRALQAKHGDTANPPEISETELATALHPTLERVSHPDIPLDEPIAPEGFSSIANESVCATFTDDRPGQVALSIGVETPQLPQNVSGPRGDIIDHVAMESLTGALLQADNALDENGPVTLIVNGLAYQIPDSRSRAALGYRTVEAARVTPTLLGLLPQGLSGEGASLSMESIVPVAQ